MNNISNIIPWVVSASIAMAALSLIAAALDYWRRRHAGEGDIEGFRLKYTKVVLEIERIEIDIAQLIAQSNACDVTIDILKRYDVIVERSTSLRWYLSKDLNIIEKMNAQDLFEAATLHNRIVGRLEGTQHLLALLHEKMTMPK